MERRSIKADLLRSLLMAIFVGSALIVINHGDHLVDEPVCPSFFLKLAFTYLVPFSVSLVSSRLATRPRA